MEAASLRGKVAIVTGASSGIGEAIAESLAKVGVKVGMLARRMEKLQELERKIRSNGGEALAVQCDVSNKDMVFEAVENVRKTLGSIDILINNAAAANGTSMNLLRVDKWLQEVDVNIIGTLHCLAACLPDMLEKKNGHVIGISSSVSRTAYPLLSVYCGTKSFMQGHSAAMRRELAPLGIKVTTILPGMVLTEMLGWMAENDVADSEMVKNFEATKKTIKILSKEDVASAVMYALNQPDHVGVNEVQVEPKDLVLAKA